MKKYESFQVTWILLIFFVPIMAFIYILYLTQAGDNPIPFVPMLLTEGLFILLALLFYGLKITVTDDLIQLKYGIGWIRKTIKLEDIKSVELVSNPWYYGLGIRVIPNGMLYNVHGLEAVELTFNNKSRVIRIGSPECEQLKMELENRLFTSSWKEK